MFTNPARGGQMPKKRLSQKMTPNPDMKKKKKNKLQPGRREGNRLNRQWSRQNPISSRTKQGKDKKGRQSPLK